MTCFNIPALTILSSEEQGSAEQRGGGEGSGVVGVAPARTNWLPGSSPLPGAEGIPFSQPNSSSVFQPSSSKPPLFSPRPSCVPRN
ncbi:hypothetical protein EYF80_002275 [Liparis tanakae]|uniref:Uncharacterized protein n=1 Tax=Liparis tanakae TaxID=230148 RepID=A0A4Z2JD32_9TELE|nr:hypothetical protein EYF80_002275 [Liparis tanakae]